MSALRAWHRTTESLGSGSSGILLQAAHGSGTGDQCWPPQVRDTTSLAGRGTLLCVLCMAAVFMIHAAAPASSERQPVRCLCDAGSDRCTGCTKGYCEPFTGCSFCDDSKGYQPDGKDGCTKGAAVSLADVTCCRQALAPLHLHDRVSSSRPTAALRTLDLILIAGTPAAAAANPTNAREAATGVSRTFALHPLLSANGVIAAAAGGPVFGFGASGQAVKVRLSNAAGGTVATASATVDSTGKWVGKLGALKPGTGYTLTAKAGSSTLKAKNIAVGQLWLVSGQSNAFVSLGDITNDGSPWESLAEAALAASSKDKDLRLFKVSIVSIC